MQRKHFLATVLGGIPLLTFANFDDETTSTRKPFIVEGGKGRYGESIKFLGVHPNNTKISGKDTNQQLSVFEYIGLGKVGPNLHMHLHQDEVFYVVEGEYRFVVGDETHRLKAGDTIFLPRMIAHTWIQLTDYGKLIYFLQPAGKMEEFFQKMNSLTERPSDEEIKRINLEHGIVNMGPPLTL
jgi:mannose-6-phosphate isomerase-like protein (cupin superfamily)